LEETKAAAQLMIVLSMRTIYACFMALRPGKYAFYINRLIRARATLRIVAEKPHFQSFGHNRNLTGALVLESTYLREGRNRRNWSIHARRNLQRPIKQH
jgi:hypothetical protein